MQDKNKKIILSASDAGLAFAMLMCIHVIISTIGQLFCSVIFKQGTSAYKLTCSTFSVISIIAVIVYFKVYRKVYLKLSLKAQKSGGVFLAISILLSAGMFLGLGFVNGVVGKLIEIVGLNPGGASFQMRTVWHFLAYSLTLALLPAVFEELFFRGLLLSGLSKAKNVVAVLVSALCFAVYHGSLSQFVYQFIYGVILGFTAIACKSIFPCIVAHFINNFSIILLNYLGVSVNLLSPVLLVIGINCLAIYLTILYFCVKKTNKNQLQTKGEVSRFYLFYGLFGTIICLSIAITNLLV